LNSKENIPKYKLVCVYLLKGKIDF